MYKWFPLKERTFGSLSFRFKTKFGDSLFFSLFGENNTKMHFTVLRIHFQHTVSRLSKTLNSTGLKCYITKLHMYIELYAQINNNDKQETFS